MTVSCQQEDNTQFIAGSTQIFVIGRQKEPTAASLSNSKL